MATAMPPTADAPRTGRRRDAFRLAVPAVLALSLAVGGIAASAPGSPVEAVCGSFQAKVDAAASGATITIPACTYKETVTIRKPLTIKAAGAVVDGENVRDNGIVVLANDVTIDGLTVRRVKSDPHVGAVWTTNGISRFTFRNGVVKDSSTVCISLNGGSGHRVLDSELTNCAKEGYFLNGVSDALFSGNDIHHNNPVLAWDPGQEAGGGKAMASQRITFDGNTVRSNGGPGIWFDNGVVDAVVTGNRVHSNLFEGIFFEISSGATITGNVVWGNGFEDPAWGYGAGITISSSDRAVVRGNTVAWNARGISVISQDRGPKPHNGITVTDNTIVAKNGDFVTGFYDDHGNTLFQAANGNSGSGNRYWVAVGEPSSHRFGWLGPKDRLADYNATPGEEGGVYLSLAQRDAALAAAGIPGDVIAPIPQFGFRAGQVAANGLVPARISWASTPGAFGYQLQLQVVGGSWSTVKLGSEMSLYGNVQLKDARTYKARTRVKLATGAWSAWRYSPEIKSGRVGEANPAITYQGSWSTKASDGAIGGEVRSSSTAGARATYGFTGRAVAWVAPRGPGYGSAEVWVDGVKRATVDLRRDAFEPRRLAFYWAWASAGWHTIQIRVLGTAGHPRVDIDAFTILR
jgi:parallel beta-helix repeat protein